MSKENVAILLLGSNLGDREKNLHQALKEIGERLGTVKRTSSVYVTAPWKMDSHNPFFNQAAEIITGLEPLEFLKYIKDIEHRMGRTRTGHYEDRVIDIDIALWGGAVIHENDLEIPHPRLHLRKFALIPLAELCPGQIHPVLEKTIGELLACCEDRSDVLLRENE